MGIHTYIDMGQILFVKIQNFKFEACFVQLSAVLTRLSGINEKMKSETDMINIREGIPLLA